MLDCINVLEEVWHLDCLRELSTEAAVKLVEDYCVTDVEREAGVNLSYAAKLTVAQADRLLGITRDGGLGTPTPAAYVAIGSVLQRIVVSSLVRDVSELNGSLESREMAITKLRAHKIELEHTVEQLRKQLKPSIWSKLFNFKGNSNETN